MAHQLISLHVTEYQLKNHVQMSGLFKGLACYGNSSISWIRYLNFIQIFLNEFAVHGVGEERNGTLTSLFFGFISQFCATYEIYTESGNCLHT